MLTTFTSPTVTPHETHGNHRVIDTQCSSVSASFFRKHQRFVDTHDGIVFPDTLLDTTNSMPHTHEEVVVSTNSCRNHTGIDIQRLIVPASTFDGNQYILDTQRNSVAVTILGHDQAIHAYPKLLRCVLSFLTGNQRDCDTQERLVSRGPHLPEPARYPRASRSGVILEGTIDRTIPVSEPFPPHSRRKPNASRHPETFRSRPTSSPEPVMDRYPKR